MRLGDLDALKEDLKQYFSDGVLDSVSAKLALNMILRKIDEVPTVAEDYDTGYQDSLEDGLDGIRPQGEWIDTMYGFHTCSICGKYGNPNFFNFCPNCGAKMKGGAE